MLHSAAAEGYLSSLYMLQYLIIACAHGVGILGGSMFSKSRTHYAYCYYCRLLHLEIAHFSAVKDIGGYADAGMSTW